MPNTNDYYTAGFSGVAHGLIRVEHFDALDRKIETALNRLPGIDELHQDRVTSLTATTSNNQAYSVTWDSAPSSYVDGIALQVRFPAVSEANPTLDVVDGDGTSLGAKPIRDVNGNNLTAGHIAAHSRAELYYVSQGTGYWILGAGGARGEPGPAGPPAGEFYVLSDTTELGFRDEEDTPLHNFGQIAFRDRGDYSGSTEYVFLDVVKSGSFQYWHHGLTATTGTAVTDTTVWARLVPVPAVSFSALTFAAALTWDVSTHANATLTMTGNITGITLSGDEDGGVYEMRIAQDATGSRTWTPPTSWLWIGGTAGVLSTAANAVDILTLRRMGTNIHAILTNGWATA